VLGATFLSNKPGARTVHDVKAIPPIAQQCSPQGGGQRGHTRAYASTLLIPSLNDKVVIMSTCCRTRKAVIYALSQ